MTTLSEIESAVEGLSPEQKFTLYRYLEGQLKEFVGQPTCSRRHSVLDIIPVSLGPVLEPWTADIDLLGEMLESRA